MTVALANNVDRLDLPDSPGISGRAVRCVFRMMAKIANDAGDFRYGLRGSKLATLTDYSLSVVRRAQRYLVDHGYIERVEVGGGRASTHWRILVDKIVATLAPGHSSRSPETQEPEPPDTAQGRTPRSLLERYREAPGQKRTTNPRLREILDAPLCEHGGLAGLLPGGRHRCPQCRSAWRAARRS